MQRKKVIDVAYSQLSITNKSKEMNEILHLINEMSPYLLLGFLIAGLMHAFVPGKYYTRYLAKNNFRSVVNAALLGIPLPLCSCGVIPTAMSLRKEGASKGAVVSFLIATPQTGIDSIAATYSLMGLPFALLRPVVALFTALFGGQLEHAIGVEQKEEHEEHEKQEETCPCCCQHNHGHHHEHEHEHEHEHDKSSDGHCCCNHTEAKAGMSFWQKIVVALKYAFVDMVEDIGKWLVVGLIVAALITVLVPDEFFAVFAGNTWLSMLLVLVISVPMYICATGSIPIAVALMLKGLTPGAALVLLMAGPAVNMASILVIRQRMGMRTLVAYLISIVVGAVLAGIGIDYLLPREWFTDNLVELECCTEIASWFEWTCTALLVLLLCNTFWRSISRRWKSAK